MAEKFLEWDATNKATQQNEALQTSAGVGDAGKIIGLDSTGRIDQTMMPIGVGPETKNLVTSENLSAGDFVNIWNDGGTIKARKADATALGKKAVGYVVDAVTAPASVAVYFESINNQLAGLTLGQTYWLSDTTAGAVTSTPPADPTEIVQELGVAVSATELAVEIGKPILLA